MASQVYCMWSGPQGSISVAKSCTEGTVGELVDEVSGLSIGEVFAGKVINSVCGSYAGGNCVVWIRNAKTGKVKVMACLNITTAGTCVEYLDQPFTVEYDDVAEAMTMAVV